MVKRNMNYLQIYFGIKQFVERLFRGVVPNRQVKVLDQERTYHLIKDQERNKNQDRSWRAYPVFAGIFWSEKIDRWAIQRMHWKRAINQSQVRQNLVQVGIVQLCKWTHFGLINFQGNPAPPVPGLRLLSIQWAQKRSYLIGNLPKQQNKYDIRDIMTIRDIKELTYKFMKLIWAWAPVKPRCILTSSAG